MQLSNFKEAIFTLLLFLHQNLAQNVSTTNTTNETRFKADGPSQEYKFKQAYFQDTKFNYLDFGNKSVAYGSDIQPCPIWILVTGFDKEGRPILLEDQKIIVDHLPGDIDYSDLKRVNYVTVPEGYKANADKDATFIRSKFGNINTSTKGYVNYPIVTHGSSTEDNVAKLNKAWYKGQEVSYFDLGLNPGNASISYQFIKSNITDPNILPVISTSPGTSNYTSFWKVYAVEAKGDGKQLTNIGAVKAYSLESSNFVILNRPMFKISTKNGTKLTNGTDDSNALLTTSSSSLYFVIFIALFSTIYTRLF